MTSGLIEFEHVTKTYPGASAPSVNDLTLRIESGHICALVGPSGSGKTTAMRMINRMHEPTTGHIAIDGVPNTSIPLEELRRSIGYVIQSSGLFPHRTVLDNVGTVPTLLGWNASDIRARSLELLEMVGLDPGQFANRYPSQLSGGQRQRVGVARALAADPPIMLMDEPFGAIDPLVRGKIQDEFLRLQEQVRKTIVIVTHDLDEAVKMGDRIAVLQEGGILARYASPYELLADPGSEFVADFVGRDGAIRQLNAMSVAQAGGMSLEAAAAQGFVLYADHDGRPAYWNNGQSAQPAIPVNWSLRDALSTMLASGVQYSAIVDEHGRAVGVISFDSIQATLRYAIDASQLAAAEQAAAEAGFAG